MCDAKSCSKSCSRCNTFKLKIKGEPGPPGPGFTCIGELCTTECNEFLAVLYPVTNLPDGALVLQSKGIGQLLRQIPTPGDASGGNCRGAYAVDWQNVRKTPDQVASGSYSVVSGGIQNKASGDQSVVGGGDANSSEGKGSTIPGGCGNTAAGDGSTASGVENSVGGTSGTAFGSLNTVNGTQSVCSGGNGSSILGNSSAVGGGSSHSVLGDYSGVFSGILNSITSNYSSVLSGRLCTIGSNFSNIGGGDDNGIAQNANYSTIPGGIGINLPFAKNTNKYASCSFGQYNDSGSLIKDLIFAIGNGIDASNTSNAFAVDFEGNVYYQGSLNPPITSQVEYMESLNGETIPIGTPIVIDSGRVRLPGVSEVPDGVISIPQGTVGNAYHEHWHKKYLTDELGRVIYEYKQVQVDRSKFKEALKVYLSKVESKATDCQKKLFDEVKHAITKEINALPELISGRIPKVNPQYKPELTYIPRSQRSEWHPVCFFGRCKILKDQKVAPSWKKLSESEKYYEYLIR